MITHVNYAFATVSFSQALDTYYVDMADPWADSGDCAGAANCWGQSPNCLEIKASSAGSTASVMSRPADRDGPEAPFPAASAVDDNHGWTDVACSAECGGGRMVRSREVTAPARYGGAPCPVLVGEGEECNTHECRKDCRVTAWEKGACMDGRQLMIRRVIVSPKGGGTECPVLHEFSGPCEAPRGVNGRGGAGVARRHFQTRSTRRSAPHTRSS